VVGGDGECVAGVVVDPVEDFDMSAVGEPPVGEIGWSAFLGLVGGKSDVGIWGVSSDTCYAVSC